MKKFRTSFSGYNKADVNEFLSEVISEYENILQKLRGSVTEIEYLNKELERYKTLEKSLNDTLLCAQEATANAQKTAIAEGKLIIEEAKKNASKIVNNSILKAQSIEKDAEELKRRVASFKTRFMALIESQMDEVSKFDDKL
jgi:cell division initiation protein